MGCLDELSGPHDGLELWFPTTPSPHIENNNESSALDAPDVGSVQGEEPIITYILHQATDYSLQWVHDAPEKPIRCNVYPTAVFT